MMQPGVQLHNSHEGLICRHAVTGEEVKWIEVSKRLTFSAACRAAIGDVLTDDDLDEMFPLAVVLGQGVFSPVCFFSNFAASEYIFIACSFLLRLVCCMHGAHASARKGVFAQHGHLTYLKRLAVGVLFLFRGTNRLTMLPLHACAIFAHAHASCAELPFK
jgi:hypothetical protein